MLGAILGDLIGAPYEFKRGKSATFEPLLRADARFTDDTICTVAIAHALVDGLEPAQALQAWGRRHADNGGWGQRFALWLTDDDPRPYGSWGNGGAMRVSPVAWLASSLDEALAWSDRVTAVTHDHPEGMRGAAATTMAVWLAKRRGSATLIRDALIETFGYDLSRTVDEIRPTYRRSEAAAESVPQALTCALEAQTFEQAVRLAVSLGGDADTQAAIAGAVAEARFGIPDDLARRGWGHLTAEMQDVLQRAYEQAASPIRTSRQSGAIATS